SVHSLARIVLLVAFILAVVVSPLRLLATGEVARYRRLRAELNEMRTRAQQKQAELVRLRAEVRALKNDKRALEAIARDELGLVREGELVLEFPAADKAATDKAATDKAATDKAAADNDVNAGTGAESGKPDKGAP